MTAILYVFSFGSYDPYKVHNNSAALDMARVVLLWLPVKKKEKEQLGP